MDNFIKTKKGININKSEIASTHRINYRNIFKNGSDIPFQEHDFVVTLKCGIQFIFESENYGNDIEKIEESLPSFMELN